MCCRAPREDRFCSGVLPCVGSEAVVLFDSELVPVAGQLSDPRGSGVCVPRRIRVLSLCRWRLPMGFISPGDDCDPPVANRLRISPGCVIDDNGPR